MQVNESELRTFIEVVTREVLCAIEETRLTDAARIAYPEAEAARLLGIEKHVLRDARLRGEVNGKLIGKRVVYSKRELDRFVAARDDKKK